MLPEKKVSLQLSPEQSVGDVWIAQLDWKIGYVQVFDLRL